MAVGGVASHYGIHLEEPEHPARVAIDETE